MKAANEDTLISFLDGNGIHSASEDSCCELAPSSPCREQCSVCSPETSDGMDAEVIGLLDQHGDALSRYAGAITRDRSLIQDSLQEAFLRYFVARSSGQPIANPRAWLFRVLRNYLIDRNRRSVAVATTELANAEQVADSNHDAEAGFLQNESLRIALGVLSRRERECMQLRLEGYEYGEIASILSIRPGTVAALLARGLKKLRKRCNISDI